MIQVCIVAIIVVTVDVGVCNECIVIVKLFVTPKKRCSPCIVEDLKCSDMFSMFYG